MMENDKYYRWPKCFTTVIMVWLIITTLAGFSYMFFASPSMFKYHVYPMLNSMNDRILILDDKITEVNKQIERMQAMDAVLLPLRGKLIVKIIPDIKMTASGLYLADKIVEIPHRGIVKTIGKPVLNKKGHEIEWGISEGEIVHFKRKWDNPSIEHFILVRDDIIAVEGKTGIRAVRDDVIVERVYKNKIGSSSIIIPQTHGIRSNMEDFYGLVISVGPENKMDIKVGDKLLYHRNEGIEFKYSGKQLFSLKIRAILAKETT